MSSEQSFATLISEDYKSPKKRVKVVISDLLLGKGKNLPEGGTNPLEEFYFDEKFREFLHFYSTGEFEKYDVELILNGDFLDFLQVDYKGHFLTVITESVSLQKLKDIIAGHPIVFEAMKTFAQLEGKSISYIVGNHDQGMLWPAARDYLDSVLKTQVRFKNLFYSFDGIHIEHGHMHEAANRFEPKKFFLKKNLPEPILNMPFGSHFFIDFVLKLKSKYPKIDKVRPFGKMLRWALVNETVFAIKEIFSLVIYFSKTLFFRNSRRAFSFWRTLKILLETASFPDLTDAAQGILEDERVHTVIFGHSHVYKYRQFANGKEYFNTGTWSEITSLDLSNLGKIGKLTYVLINYSDDGLKSRAKLKEWRGYHRVEEDVVTY